MLTLDIKSAYGEASALHANNRGYFSVLEKYQKDGRDGRSTTRQTSYAMNQLESVVKAIGNAPDTYISQSSFINKNRRMASLCDIGCAWVDIDCYKFGLESTEEFASDLMDKATCYGVPLPTYIIYSGRGIYLKWLLAEPVGAAHLHRWNAMQMVLTTLFHALGADMASRDAARVLRVIGSTNTTSNSSVRPAWISGRRYTFEELVDATSIIELPDIKKASHQQIRSFKTKVKKLQELDPNTLADIKRHQASVVEHFTSFSNSHQPIMIKHMSLQQLNWQRFIDLRDLSIMRGGVQKGSRDLSLFWMGTFLSHSGVLTPDNFFSEMEQLASGFQEGDFDPLKDNSMSSLLGRLHAAQKGESVTFNGKSYSSLYTPTNDRLIDIFEITDDEQSKLSTIIDGREKRRRADLKVPGRHERREARIEWRSLAKTLAAEAVEAGKKPCITEIAQKVNVHKTQVSRLLAEKIGLPRKKRAIRRPTRAACTHEQQLKDGTPQYSILYGIKAARAHAGKLIQSSNLSETNKSQWDQSNLFLRGHPNPFVALNRSSSIKTSTTRQKATSNDVNQAVATDLGNIKATPAKVIEMNANVAEFPLSSKRYSGIGRNEKKDEKGAVNCGRPLHLEEKTIESGNQPNNHESMSGGIRKLRHYPFSGAHTVRLNVVGSSYKWPQRTKNVESKKNDKTHKDLYKLMSDVHIESFYKSRRTAEDYTYLEQLDEAAYEAETERLLRESLIIDAQFKEEKAKRSALEVELKKLAHKAVMSEIDRKLLICQELMNKNKQKSEVQCE